MTRKVELVRLHTQGHKKGGVRDENQNLLGEGLLRKNKKKCAGRAGKQPKQLHETKNVGQTAWRPYAPTGMTRHDDDDDDDFFSQIHHFCHCTHFFLDIGDAKSIRKRHHKNSFQGQPVINNISKNSNNNSIKQCQKQNNKKECCTIVDKVQNLIRKHAVAINREMLFRVHTCNDGL